MVQQAYAAPVMTAVRTPASYTKLKPKDQEGSKYWHLPGQEAPTTPPTEKGVTDNCMICLPESACRVLGVKPNINDKGFEKRLWFGRVWQLRALQTKQYREMAAKLGPSRLTAQQKHELDLAMADPVKKALLMKMQTRWRGAVTRSRSRLTVLEPLAHEPGAHCGTILFMHGSGGMTYNNIRYCRKVAAMGFLVIAPDSMAGGEYRAKSLSKPLTSSADTPYWDDLGLYSSDAQGEYTYSTDAKAVIGDPERFRTLYANVFRMRSGEMHWILGHLPQYIKKNGVFTMGQSEGAMTVARFDDRRYGAMIRGRIISAFSVEYCYFTPSPEAALYGGNPEVPTLNIIGDADQYFGNIDSVAKAVSEDKAHGGYGDDVITGNGFKNMKKQQLRRGMVAVMQNAKHDASETHDNFLRDLLRAFLSAPGDCHRIPSLWRHCDYLTSKVHVVERDSEGVGERLLIYCDELDFPSTLPYQRELAYRQLGNTSDGRRKQELSKAKLESAVIAHKAQQESEKLLAQFKLKPPKPVEAAKTAYCEGTEMPRKGQR